MTHEKRTKNKKVKKRKKERREPKWWYYSNLSEDAIIRKFDDRKFEISGNRDRSNRSFF